MKDLFYKEFKLWWHPAWFLFLLFGSLLLIPSWPFFIAFMYIFIALNTVFIVGAANHDIFFTASLPVRRKDTVLARTCFVAVVEVLQILVAIPFAVVNNAVYPQGNQAGMNTNFAFFGLVFIMYAVFNLIFLPMFYKTAYKMLPMLWAALAVIVYVVAVDMAVVLIPVLRENLDGLGASHFASQLPVLIAGIALFALLTRLAYRISAKRFEKVDL